MDAVTPLGRSDTARWTLPVNPYCGWIWTLVVVVVPCPTKTLAGLLIEFEHFYLESQEILLRNYSDVICQRHC